MSEDFYRIKEIFLWCVSDLTVRLNSLPSAVLFSLVNSPEYYFKINKPAYF